LNYETRITPYKVNQNKLYSSIPTQLNVEEWDEKISIKKEQKKQPKSTRVNILNPRLKSWDHDNLIKNKLK